MLPRGSGVRSLASVDILEAHDVILAQVGAGLHLDDLEGDHAGVLDAVPDANRDVGRLVLLEQEHVLATGDARGPRHHHPVLGAMVVHLQRESRTGLDLESLHLETPARLDAVVAAPGTKYLAVQRVLVA